MSQSPTSIPRPCSVDEDVLHDFHPFFKVRKDGRAERYPFHNQPNLPPGLDPKTGIVTKDNVISSASGVVVRLFSPKISDPDRKLPLIIHIHGGGFCVGSALDAITGNFVTYMMSHVEAIVLSVEYRLAPEHPLPIAYDDAWESLKWVGLHSTGSGPEPILNRSVDFGKVFLLGESAGANIAQHLVVRAGVEKMDELEIAGMIAVHPFFVGDEKDEHYKFCSPASSGCKDDPKLYPGSDPNMARLATKRVLVCLAGKDHLRARGLDYYETLKKSGWVGEVELFESENADHCFHMFSQDEKTKELVQKFTNFFTRS